MRDAKSTHDVWFPLREGAEATSREPRDHGEVPKFDPRKPWDYCFKAAAADDKYWDKEVMKKAALLGDQAIQEMGGWLEAGT